MIRSSSAHETLNHGCGHWHAPLRCLKKRHGAILDEEMEHGLGKSSLGPNEGGKSIAGGCPVGGSVWTLDSVRGRGHSEEVTATSVP
ncbi:hypothetical protein VTN77DRAFT_1753 [Rasamsonia byssochlamydoides]|uniref:uncharacterized protein n=1 Tax=Rasamsonia byssochlamydoides TaxID=89139 RepID=UPI003744926D